MIKDFDALKKQLAELAEVVNSFKSEAVQLRIVDLVLGSGAPVRAHAAGTEDQQHKDLSPPSKSQRKAKKKDSSGEKQPRKTSKHGPATILDELIQEGFFGEAKTINQIISHSDLHKARKMKPNELSGPLARFVRGKKLSRKKNADGQYEYTSPQ